MRPLQTGFGLQPPVAYALYTGGEERWGHGGEEGWGPWRRGGMGAMEERRDGGHEEGCRKQRLEGEEEEE